MNQQTIPITRQRTLQEIFRTSVDYFFRNIGTLLPAVALLGFSIIILSLLFAYGFTENYSAFERLTEYRDKLPRKAFISLCFSYVIYLAGVFFVVLAVCRHLGASDLVAAGDQARRNGSFSGLTEDAGRSVVNFICVYAVWLVLKAAFNYFSGVLSAETGYGGTTGFGLDGLFDSLLRHIHVVAALPFFVYFGFATLYVCYRDQLGIDDGLKKVWACSQNNVRKAWLSAFFFICTAYIISLLLNVVMYMIMNALWSISGDYGRYFFAQSLVQEVVYFLLVMFLVTGMAFTFGSLEDEKEGIYLKRKVEEI